MTGFLTQTGWAGHSRVAFRWTLKAPSGGSPVWLAPLFVMERSLVGSFFRQKTTRNVFQTQNEFKRYLIAVIGMLTNFLVLPLLWVYTHQNKLHFVTLNQMWTMCHLFKPLLCVQQLLLLYQLNYGSQTVNRYVSKHFWIFTILQNVLKALNDFHHFNDLSNSFHVYDWIKTNAIKTEIILFPLL